MPQAGDLIWTGHVNKVNERTEGLGAAHRASCAGPKPGTPGRLVVTGTRACPSPTLHWAGLQLGCLVCHKEGTGDRQMANKTQAQIRYHFGLPLGEGMTEERQGFLFKIRSEKGLPAKLMYVGVWGFPSTCFLK